MKRIPLLVFALSFILTLNSCKFARIMKSPDVETKYKSAMDYYDAKDYSRALQLFDQIAGVIRATDKAQDVNFKYAYCYFYMKDYTLASYYFKRYFTNYSNTANAEEALFMSAYCNYLNSPEYSLDQTSTYEAIKDLQLFINIYPESKRASECNDLIDDLRAKLEFKDYRIARLYYRMGDFNAAITSYNNLLKDYPETPHREEILFQIVKIYQKYADESIELKKKERYNKAILAYNDLLKEFPETRYRDEAKVVFDKCNEELQLLAQPETGRKK